nr:PREDICTED: mucosa-associated lymphoid tissue lymphoma translocation protein 1-like isoform X1 [Bemisia tabaci]
MSAFQGTMNRLPDPDDDIGDHMMILRNVKACLDTNDNWRTVVNVLAKFRLPVVFDPFVLRKMEMASSPADFLLNELIMRCCKVKYLCEILRNSSQYDALSYLVKPEPVEITKQPGGNEEVLQIRLGGDLKLHCEAIGIPPPTFQWYFGNVVLENQTSSCLSIPSFSDNDVGEYHCSVMQQLPGEVREIHSNVVYVEIMVHLPVFVIQLPKVLNVKFNEGVILRIGISSAAHLEWYKNNELLQNEKSDVLQLSNITENTVIMCRASNSAGEVFSDRCRINVMPHEFELTNNNQNFTTAKFAILIANEKYDNLNRLYTPAYDASTLANILIRLNFQVLTLKNLTKDEMKVVLKKFCQLILPGSYVFFYYVGHGFQIGDKYMMGVDTPCPQSYLRSDCICDQEVIKDIMMAVPKLLVIILDMCLRVPDKSENPEIYSEVPQIVEYERNGNCNLVQGYATCCHLGAYEKRTSQNGLYVQHLAKFLDKNLPITQILQLAHLDFNRCKGTDRQKPYLSSDDVKCFKLTDPIKSDQPASRHLDLFNNLPESGEICFPCIKKRICITFSKHNFVYCNAIDVQLSQIFDSHSIVATVNHDVLETSWKVDMEKKCSILTIENLQRIKFQEEIIITLKICKFDMTSNETGVEDDSQNQLKVLDYFQINIGSPLISYVDLKS